MFESISVIESIADRTVSNQADINQFKTDSVNNQNFFIDQLNSINSEILKADEMLTAYALNEPGISVHELIISMEKAKLSLQVAVEVRNKIVESYREITSMQV